MLTFSMFAGQAMLAQFSVLYAAPRSTKQMTSSYTVRCLALYYSLADVAMPELTTYYFSAAATAVCSGLLSVPLYDDTAACVADTYTYCCCLACFLHQL